MLYITNARLSSDIVSGAYLLRILLCAVWSGRDRVAAGRLVDIIPVWGRYQERCCASSLRCLDLLLGRGAAHISPTVPIYDVVVHTIEGSGGQRRPAGHDELRTALERSRASRGVALARLC